MGRGRKDEEAAADAGGDEDNSAPHSPPREFEQPNAGYNGPGVAGADSSQLIHDDERRQ